MKNLHILFICVGNSCRSQMAEGFAKSVADKEIQVSSAGLKPLGWIDPQAIDVMKEIGIDISKNKSKLMTDELIKEADILISMIGVPLEELLNIKKKRSYTWNIQDPFGEDLEDYRKIREDVKTEVQKFLNNLKEEKMAKTTKAATKKKATTTKCATKKKSCSQTKKISASKKTVFSFDAPWASKVMVAGDFNSWKPTSLKKNTNGLWEKEVTLKKGSYQYRFVVDDNWYDDPSAGQYAPNEFGTQNAVVTVG